MRTPLGFLVASTAFVWGGIAASQPQPAPEQPAPAAQPQPAGHPQPYGQQGGYAPPPATAGGPAELPNLSVVLRAGYLVVGSGEDQCECDGSTCPADSSGTTDYNHKGALLLGADFLWAVSSTLRVGPGLQFGTSAEVEPDGSSRNVGVGADVSLSFVLQADFPISDTVRLGPRGQLGAMVLLPGDDLDEQLEGMKGRCESAHGDDCDGIVDGLHAGFNVGLGAGVTIAVSRWAQLRADLMIQPYYISLYSWDAGGEADATTSETLSGTRSYLMAGVEF